MIKITECKNNRMLKEIYHRIRRLVSSKKKTPKRVYEDDVYIVSYPKSGNTWIRFLIGNYVTGNEFNFDNYNSLIPDIHYNPNQCGNLERPRFIKSHFSYVKKYPNVIYIVRDGRDVAVSYYHYSIKMGNIDKSVKFTGFMDEFNSGSVGPCRAWGKHVESWIGKDEDSILVVRYEDLLEDASTQLRRILSFVDIEVRQPDLQRAVKASNFENMKSMEEKQQQKEGENFPGKGSADEGKRFMRKGERGDWQDWFDEELLHEFESTHRAGLKYGGYPVYSQ